MSASTFAKLDLEHSREAPTSFDWPLANEAELLIRKQLAAFLERNSFARTLSARMRDETATDFFEWVDHLVISPGEEKALADAGFAPDAEAETPTGESVFQHPKA